MSQEVYEILELNKIKNRVKKLAATKMGAEIISELSPVSDVNYVEKNMKEVSSARSIMDEYGTPPFGGIRDLRKILNKVDKGIVLSALELQNVMNTLESFSEINKYFNEINEKSDPRIIENYYGVVIQKAQKISPLPELIKELDRCLDEYGEIKDTASKKLANLRSEIEKMGNKIRDKMESIVHSNKYKDILQDQVVTKRGDRYVVPVKQDYQNAFSGIVHDQSSSGMTVFMEPLDVVKLNNKLREYKKREEQEVFRILQKLTANIQDEQFIIKNNLRVTTVLDVVFSRAEYSILIDGIAPEINKEGIVKIKAGRHPLLGEEAVPINIEVGKDFTTLVITGPNTGGKTVALKTLGLFVLMVEIGLHIPADTGTQISIFKDVFADIGDEQSIEQNLSTFSSHMTRIKSFLNTVGKSSLVLMDELGAGTDPKEGAALGISILESLRRKGAVTVATTHYSQLKSYAYNQKGVENASVEFDLETLKPTYKFQMGIPGGSNAFAIASRLGIPDEIIEQSRTLLSGEDIEIENIINGLNSERKKYYELVQEIKEKEKKVEELKEKYNKMLQKHEEEQREIIQEAENKAAEIIEKSRRESKRIISNLKEKQVESRSEVDRLGNKIHQNFKKTEDELFSEEEKNNKVKEVQKKYSKIKKGDMVRLQKVGRKGKVIEIDKEKKLAKIQAGVMTVTAGIDELIKVEIHDDNTKAQLRKYNVKKIERVSTKLDLRGKRYDEAVRMVDKYLDDVFLANLKEVEIIHGKGTGTLREAVKKVLEENPHAVSYRLGRPEEGGTGVTIVEIE